MAERKYDGFLPGQHAIEAYGSGGFRFGEMSHRGSILALPSGVRIWTVDDVSRLAENSLEPLFEEPVGAVQFLLIGTGAVMRPIPSALRQRLRAAGIGVDAMATGHAVSTYNIMLGERRPVAAALIGAP